VQGSVLPLIWYEYTLPIPLSASLTASARAALSDAEPGADRAHPAHGKRRRVSAGEILSSRRSKPSVFCRDQRRNRKSCVQMVTRES